MFIILALLLTATQIVFLVAAPLVQLPNGLIQGRETVTIQNTTYFAFEKIPYAKPPVGALRFKAPQPPDNWEGTLQTTHLDVSCYQQNANSQYESEDCLYINVYTPQLPTNDANVSLPVMLYIHGGGFVGGSSLNVYSDRIVDQNVVLATINYRLGPFGFISTQDEIIPGNNGLKDQHLALRWAHDNINLFGGDPEKITIFGQSAGSASVAYQLLNQQNAGLFSGAILQSGSFLSPWAYQRRAREIAFATAAFLNNTFETNNDSEDLLHFLLTVDAEDLDTASELYHNSESGPEDTEILQGFYWAPVIEVKNPDAFLTKKMYLLLQAGNVLRVPILIGMTNEEGLSFNDANVLKSAMTAYDEHLGWLVPNDMNIADESSRTEMGRLIREIYTGGEPLVNHLGSGVRYCSDTSFTRSIIKHAELFSKFSKTYFYEFSYDGKLGNFDVHYDEALTVTHSEDTRYIFCSGSGCDITGYPQSDQITSDRIIKIWTDFAKYLNPTPETSELLQNITWPLLSVDDGDFLYVDINENLQIRNHPKHETYQRWNDLYSSLNYTDFDTY